MNPIHLYSINFIQVFLFWFLINYFEQLYDDNLFTLLLPSEDETLSAIVSNFNICSILSATMPLILGYLRKNEENSAVAFLLTMGLLFFSYGLANFLFNTGISFPKTLGFYRLYVIMTGIASGVLIYQEFKQGNRFFNKDFSWEDILDN